ncbi:MAG: hypothetical protein GX233_01070 [Erysipelothrix sp.]|nr:hypothetical protein [Erysipelothrix sp.]
MFKGLFRKKQVVEDVSVCVEEVSVIEKKNDGILHFDNFHFKLAIIQILMYELNVLDTQFDLYDFVDEYTHRPIYLREEGYDLIPEVVDYFKDFEIDSDYAQYITNISMNPMNEIYTHIFPYWDGSDDTFDILNVSIEELTQFHNLETVDLLGHPKVESLFASLGFAQ